MASLSFRLLASDRFINHELDAMSGFGSGDHAFRFGENLCGLGDRVIGFVASGRAKKLSFVVDFRWCPEKLSSLFALTRRVGRPIYEHGSRIESGIRMPVRADLLTD